MRRVEWNRIKNRKLKETRGVSFENLLRSEFIGLYRHPKRKQQFLLLYKYNNYIWLVPCIIKGDSIFLKTLYPSRKFTKMYKKGEIK